ncbi:diacylglycerol/lipid kinase family protein [Mangrovibrevibacter kandeliae]|uniref:diacylglycerol/lipid kinase family protein n=1 Tax=Mangrovibrevibacter kandeliae TaxID=2968473 RepID=UPI002117ECC6|nr:diacylglycerol kinase family protein [Aurantimonas sp. CSK15Z-1]MCQ8780950.1 diacylglycerol kinase [Aurantimonas sp. CSK15Z-1]
MKVVTILNRDGGTLRTTDLDWLQQLIRDEFSLHGHTVEIKVVAGAELPRTLREVADREDIDCLLVGGGDGTVSFAASLTAGTPIALAILPAGTMNLFARSLQIPMDLRRAVAALAGGRLARVDHATANGAPFVHQLAVGLHARMVRFRERFHYGTRLGKILATTRAVLLAIRRPPSFDVELEVDGQVRRLRTPGVAISNNVYGDGHLPFADDPQGGALGIYVCESHDPRSIARLTFDIAMGSWRRNPCLTVYESREVTLTYNGKRLHKRMIKDGEIENLYRVTRIRLEAGALRVVVPADATYLNRDQASGTSATGRFASAR